MGDLFHSFVNTMLGDVGRYILNYYFQNENIFLCFFTAYALLLLYARCILVFYYPHRMRVIVKNLSNQQDIDKARQVWLQEKSSFPFYIIVPSRNELWIKRASKSSIHHETAFFREKDVYKTDYEQLNAIQSMSIKEQPISTS